MSANYRSSCVLLASAIIFLAVGFLVSTVNGQIVVQPEPFPGGPGMPQPQPRPKTDDASSQYSAVKLIENSDYRRYLNAARDYIKDAATGQAPWLDAVMALQTIVDNQEDYYVRVKDINPDTGEEVARWTSVKYEATKLLGSMPKEGLDVYEIRFGPKAKQLLDQAKKTGDINLLAEVAQRFIHTKAGPEANDLLATYFLDRGQYFMAALRFDRLMEVTENQDRIPDLTMVKAAIAYRRSGEMAKFKSVWDKLEPRLERNGGLNVGGQVIRVAALEKILSDSPDFVTTSPHDWLLVRGNETNTAQGIGSSPLLDETLWAPRPTVLDKSEYSVEEVHGRIAKTNIADAVAYMRNNPTGLPVMSGFFPLATDGKLLYRTYAGISAITLKDIKDENGELLAKAGDIEWRAAPFEGSLAVSLENKIYGSTLQSWLTTDYQQQHPLFKSQLIYENSVNGTLSSDMQNVYAVDDLAIPVPPQKVQQFFFYNQNNGLPSSLKERVLGNSLQAFQISSGKILWRIGLDGKDPEFKDSHFLGPPLPVGGKLYILNEKSNGELRLLTIDPTTGDIQKPVQNLGTVDQADRFYMDPNRRIHAVHLAYGEGLLVCPTNAGQVIGIDLMSRTLAWAYPYREEYREDNPNNPGGQILQLSPSTWKVAPPAIQKGLVVFTAPDAHSLHCINLKDGTINWKRRKSDNDLFMAGVWNGQIVVVAKNTCYALRLQDGAMLWSVTTGDMPSGQGIASEGIYYLPLQSGEICAIDLAQGRVKARNRPSSRPEHIPGNLVLFEGAVLSQTPDHIVAYPQLTAKLEVARKSVATDPTSLEKLALLGELRLADGQVKQAVQDLRLVYRKDPPDPLRQKVRNKLYEAMTDLFNADFQTASTMYMDEYRELCKVPGNGTEQQQREAQFLRLVGKGREKQGDLVSAFRAYREFGALPLYQKEGVPAEDDPTRRVPSQVWLRARISNMFAKATPAQRQPLQEEIAKEWATVQDTNNLNAIRGFVNMFDVPFPVGQKARLQLANNIIEKNDRGSFLEAELSLEQLRSGALRKDPQVGGKALEALARLAVRRGSSKSLNLAASYYRQLAEAFPNAEIRDGKTGRDYLNNMATDKRFLQYLEANSNRWPEGKIRTRELESGSVNTDMRSFVFHPRGDLTPITSQMRVMLDPSNRSNPALKIWDVANNKEIWSENLGLVQTNYQYFQYLYNQVQNNNNFMKNSDFRHFYVKGHLAVVQVGTMAYCLDLENPRIIWRRALFDDDLIRQGITPQNIMPDQDGRLVMMIYNRVARASQRIRIGEVGAVQASYVALVKQNELEVLDPLTGKVLWSKDNIPNSTRAFGDDQFIYLVDVNNGNVGGTTVLRATDGAPVAAKDFGFAYRNNIRVLGNRILTSASTPAATVMRLYDIPNSNDVWVRNFPAGSKVLKTLDDDLAGVVDPQGKLTILDVNDNSILMEGNVAQFRISPNELKDVDNPLLVADNDHFYVALNKPIDSQQVVGGQVGNNFYAGLACEPVNGWVCAFARRDGNATIQGTPLSWKKGDMVWHSYRPISNQMLVVEQFEKMPILLFTARYNRMFMNGNFRGTTPVSVTQSIDKRNGKMVYSPLSPQPYNGASPRFNSMVVDSKNGTISLVSYSRILQHFVDDGRSPTGTVQPANSSPDSSINDPSRTRPNVPVPGAGGPVQRIIGPDGVEQVIPLNRRGQE